ncbi:GNAT family N-acetyltransferase [Mucilaginibacter psychrotolerans]|uniref:N-acetyltransferase n=1 Tax=Mucilaginibacter psychrotolerans TaxID=1524096 RepID=A0A4Y8SPH2_9SPHI|nr:N-acetyltransferase [Mucilaginibacter psychrotolerans]TFF40949.1 N-acetyltransferase [Mucilaginibacter psychrotolerans]
MKYVRISSIDLNDPFFDSLKLDYAEFQVWFNKKAAAGEGAFVMYDDNLIQGFLYLKIEVDAITDVIPILAEAKRVKVGTFKINPHGTRLGERFIKKMFDFAINKKVDSIYVTIFSKHAALLNLFQKYGFQPRAKKTTPNGVEEVLIKDMSSQTGEITLDYPLIKIVNTSKYLLSIYPLYHSRLFPDSLLNSETYSLIKDVSHTNSIHKIYICYMDVSALKTGDNIIIYRTSDGAGPAHYRSVATSVCVVEELKSKRNFANIENYLKYCKDYSIFDEGELEAFYNQNNKYFYVIKMTYNAAFSKRVTRGNLIEKIGLNPDSYWGFMKLSDGEFNEILKLGKISESIIVD